MHYLAFDLGGSSMKSAVIDDDYKILKTQKYIISGESWDSQDSEAITLYGIDSAESFAKAIIAIRNEQEYPVDGICFSYNCPVNHITGDTFVGGSSQRFLNNQNFPRLFSGICELPVSVAKDSNCQLLAEKELGSLMGVKNAISLGIGTGLACGILINDEIVLGQTGSAGEISSALIRNKSGKFASIVNDTSVRTFISNIAAASGMALDTLNGYQVFDLIKNGSECVLAAYRDYCLNIAVQIANLVSIFNPQKITIGGGITDGTPIVDEIREQYINLNKTLDLDMEFSRADVEIVRSKFAGKANLLGAVIAMKKYTLNKQETI